MQEEQNNGNRPNQTYSSHTFAKMSKKCSEEFSYVIEKSNIKNCIKTLKANFHACHDLYKNLSRFVQNLITRPFEAEAKVWKPLIEVSYFYFDIINIFLEQVSTFYWYLL